MPTEPGIQFLKEKYDLHNKPEVDFAAERTEHRTGEEVPEDPSSRIDNYLHRFTEIIDRDDPEKRQRGIDALKKVLFDNFVTKYEDIPENYWKLQETIMRERGQSGDWNIATDEDKEKVRQETAAAMIGDQQASLEQWIDYFAMPDSSYIPDYLKYWTFRSIIGLQEYDKENHRFPKRSRGTLKQFPDINQEALAYVLDGIGHHIHGQPHQFEYDISSEEQAKFKQYLTNENFANLYAWATEQINPIPEHLLPVTAGRWVKFDQGSDCSALAGSIRGKATGWCTAGESTAKAHLSGGDFYVYYSNNDEGNSVNPRIAIRMEQGKIAEVRGIAYKQNLDPYMSGVLAEKLAEFPDKDQYLKKESDMQKLTYIDHKMGSGQELSKDDLSFLYEIDSPIEGFGYQKDPRIAELRSRRNPEADMPIVFECDPSQIAQSLEQININTKAFVGKLEPDIFNKLPQTVEHIYTQFPEGKIHRLESTIGGKTRQQLETEMQDRSIKISTNILHSPDFATLDNAETITLIRLRVLDLGFIQNPTTDQLYARAGELGLELCPAEVGPHLRLQDLEQPLNNWYTIGMKPIAHRVGSPYVFFIAHDSGGLWLSGHWADPTDGWNLDYRFVFRLRKHNLDAEIL